jgi:hypothetical protein
LAVSKAQETRDIFTRLGAKPFLERLDRAAGTERSANGLQASQAAVGRPDGPLSREPVGFWQVAHLNSWRTRERGLFAGGATAGTFSIGQPVAGMQGSVALSSGRRWECDVGLRCALPNLARCPN